MTCEQGVIHTGPCGSSIQSGFPRIAPSSGRQEWQIGYLVPGNRLCCFAQRILGIWTTNPNPPHPAELSSYSFRSILQPAGLPEICGEGAANPQLEKDGVFIEPYSLSVNPSPQNVSWPIWLDTAKIGQRHDYEDPCVSDGTEDIVCGPNGEIAPNPDSSAGVWNWLYNPEDYYLYKSGCVDPPTPGNIYDQRQADVPVLVRYRHHLRRLPVDLMCLAENDGTGVSTPPTEDLFQVEWPTHLEVRKQAGIDGRTIDSQKLSFCQPSGLEEPFTDCCTVPEDAKFWSPITTDKVDVIWREAPVPNWGAIGALRGHANSTAMFGYPAYGLIFLGYSYVERVNFFGQRVYDVTFNFMAKTVPAAGETYEYELPGEVMSDQVGFWGRAYCETPLPGTSQHWQFTCQGEDFFFPSSQWMASTGGFRDLFSMSTYTPP